MKKEKREYVAIRKRGTKSAWYKKETVSGRGREKTMMS